MSLWTLDLPPLEARKRNLPVYLDQRGWVITYSNGTYDIIAIGNRSGDAGAANIVGVRFEQTSYNQGDPLKVIVTFNEQISVVAGLTIEVSWSGVSNNFVATAAAQTSVNEVVFDATVPSEPGELNIAAQTLLGTATDDVDAVSSDLTLPASVADTVEDIVVT